MLYPEACCVQPPPPPPPQSQSGSSSVALSAAALDSVQAAAPSAAGEGAVAPVPDDAREPPLCWRSSKGCQCPLLPRNLSCA